jgi:hypothetical protein
MIAAERASKIGSGDLTLDHVVQYERELRESEVLKKGMKAPLLLPDYRYEKALTKVHQ